MKKKHLILSIVGGLLAGYAMAAPYISAPIVTGHNYNNCQALLACSVYGTKIKTIDPECCSENSSTTSCADYSVEEWQCAAGGTGRYRNYALSWGPYVGYNCDSGAGCY